MNNSIEPRFGAPRLPLIDYPSLCPKNKKPSKSEGQKSIYAEDEGFRIQWRISFHEFGVPATGCICHLLNPYICFFALAVLWLLRFQRQIHSRMDR